MLCNRKGERCATHSPGEPILRADDSATNSRPAEEMASECDPSTRRLPATGALGCLAEATTYMSARWLREPLRLVCYLSLSLSLPSATTTSSLLGICSSSAPITLSMTVGEGGRRTPSGGGERLTQLAYAACVQEGLIRASQARRIRPNWWTNGRERERERERGEGEGEARTAACCQAATTRPSANCSLHFLSLN